MERDFSFLSCQALEAIVKSVARHLTCSPRHEAKPDLASLGMERAALPVLGHLAQVIRSKLNQQLLRSQWISPTMDSSRGETNSRRLRTTSTLMRSRRTTSKVIVTTIQARFRSHFQVLVLMEDMTHTRASSTIQLKAVVSHITILSILKDHMASTESKRALEAKVKIS